MKVRLKLKFRVLNEPEKWKNSAGHRNMQKGHGKASGNQGRGGIKKGTPHPIGFSGRTLSLKGSQR